jgi:Fic family protein
MRPSDKELFEYYFKEDVVPEGYYTIAQIVEQTGATLSSVSYKMNQLVREGKAEKKEFIIANGRFKKKTAFYKVI